MNDFKNLEKEENLFENDLRPITVATISTEPVSKYQNYRRSEIGLLKLYFLAFI